MLTKKEMLIVASAAEKFPRNKGFQLYADMAATQLSNREVQKRVKAGRKKDG